METEIIECVFCHETFSDRSNHVCKSFEYFSLNQDSVNSNISGSHAATFEYLLSEYRKCEMLLVQNEMEIYSVAMEATSQKKAIETEFLCNEIAEQYSPPNLYSGAISATASSEFYGGSYMVQRHKFTDMAIQKDDENIEKCFFPKENGDKIKLKYNKISEQSLKFDYSNLNSAFYPSESRQDFSTVDLEAQKEKLSEKPALQDAEDIKSSSQVISHVQHTSDDETVNDYWNMVSISTTNAVANPSINASEPKFSFSFHSPINSVLSPSDPYDGLITMDPEIQKEKLNERSAMPVDDDIKCSQITSNIQETSVSGTVEDNQNLDSPSVLSHARSFSTNDIHLFWSPENQHFVCPTCGKSNKYKDNFARHLRIHSGEKPFSCHLCDMCFTRKNNLTNHIKTHTGEKSFYCDICGKGYITNYKLQSHVLTHAEEKPFACDICKRRYTRKDSLIRHIKTHSNIL